MCVIHEFSFKFFDNFHYSVQQTKDTFNELKRTLKLKTKEAQWAREEARQRLLKKIDSIELALPAVSYFKNRDSLYNEYNISQVMLFFNIYFYIFLKFM